MAEMVEEKVESEYSGSIMKRLMSYMKPYMKQMILSLVLVLLITGFELLRPILIGDAIDTYIEGYNTPYAVVGESDLSFQGDYLSKDLTGADTFAQLVMFEDQYYYFNDLTKKQSDELYELSKGAISPEKTSENEIVLKGITGKKLAADELKILRKIERKLEASNQIFLVDIVA